LPIQAPHSRALWKACHERSGSELGSTTTRWEHRANCDIFDKRRVDFGARDEGFECMGEEIGGGSVFEASFAAFGERRAEGAGYDDV